MTPDDIGRTSRTATVPKPAAIMESKPASVRDYALSKVDFFDPTVGQSPTLQNPPAKTHADATFFSTLGRELRQEGGLPGQAEIQPGRPQHGKNCTQKPPTNFQPPSSLPIASSAITPDAQRGAQRRATVGLPLSRRWDPLKNVPGSSRRQEIR